MNSDSNKNGEEPRVDLGALAPRDAWVARLPELGRAAGRRAAAQDDWLAGVTRAARWAVPAAAVVAAACWLVSASTVRPAPAQTALLLTGNDVEVLAAISLEGAR